MVAAMAANAQVFDTLYVRNVIHNRIDTVTTENLYVYDISGQCVDTTCIITDTVSEISTMEIHFDACGIYYFWDGVFEHPGSKCVLDANINFPEYLKVYEKHVFLQYNSKSTEQ